MQLNIRQEQPADHPAVFHLIEKAFRNEEFTDHQEHHLVNRLRKSEAFIPEFSLVAETDDRIVGHILLTGIKIKNGKRKFDSLALAPVSVLPQYQNRGIGKKLIRSAHQAARKSGHNSIILLGHPGYYSKFGYTPADSFGIELPFDAPIEYCMAVELTEDGLQEISGIVEYPAEFFE